MTVKKEEHGAADRAASLAVTPPHLQATMYQVIQATVSRGYMSKHLNKEILVLKQEQGSYRQVSIIQELYTKKTYYFQGLLYEP